jgi:hypothetical protein
VAIFASLGGIALRSSLMRTFDIGVTRDGRWWMIHIPELRGLTQARNPGEIEDMARSYIAIAAEIPIEDIEVRIVTRCCRLPTVRS